MRTGPPSAGPRAHIKTTNSAVRLLLQHAAKRAHLPGGDVTGKSTTGPEPQVFGAYFLYVFRTRWCLLFVLIRQGLRGGVRASTLD